jgi:short subunit dehydrogenase-like uncharacterized protein
VSASQWVLYGAYGYTGELVARAAVAAGMCPLLAGRREEPLRRLARELGLAHHAAGLEPAALDALLAGRPLVLHAAGPFRHTSRAMVDACLRAPAHYLDLTGEIPVFEAVLARHAEAEAAGVTLLPGCGFDVVPSDCLARRLSDALPRACRLELALATRGGLSRGTTRTMIDSLPHAGAEREGGAIVPLPPAAYERDVAFPFGVRRVASIGWGDVATAFHTTGIPNIRVYAAMSPPRIARLRRLRRWLPLLGRPPVKRLLALLAPRRGPDAAERARGAATVWGRVEDDAGAAVESTVSTPDGYAFTAAAAVHLVRAVLAEPRGGAFTPAGRFGAGLVEELPGCSFGPLVRFAAPGEATSGEPPPGGPLR